MQYDNIIITKDWGEEYLLYRNSQIGIWHLKIKKGECTSLHCHPKKKTSLIVVKGIAQIEFFNGNTQILNVGQKVTFRKGTFHRTTAITDLELIESECPNIKTDILRLDDKYGRTGKKFEEIPNDTIKYNNLTILSRKNINRNIGNCIVNIINVKNKDELRNTKCDILIGLNKGGLWFEGEITFAGFTLGDCIYVKDIPKIIDKLQFREMKIMGITNCGSIKNL